MTEYVILRGNGPDGGWKEIARKSAGSEQAAIRASIDGTGGGAFIAIPARNFRPRTVTVERVERVSVK